MNNILLSFPNKMPRRKNNIVVDIGSYSSTGATLSWDEAVEVFLQAKQSETDSKRTVQYERDNLGSYKRILIEQDMTPSVEEVNVELIRKHFVMYMAEKKGYALNTINNRIKTLKRLFTFLEREGWIVSNPTTLLKTRSGQQPIIYSFTEEQVVALLAGPKKETFTGFRDYTMMVLLFDTGIRLGEIVHLKISQVDLKMCFLHGVIGKSKRPRDVPFSDETRKVLQKYTRIRGDAGGSENLFVSIDYQPLKIRTIQQIVHDYGAQAKIEAVRVSPHTFRHTFEKLYILNGGDPYSLQEILGHTSQDMVKRYINLWKPEKRLQHMKASPLRNLLNKRY